MTDAAPNPDPNNAEIPPETPADSAEQSSLAQGEVDALTAAAPGANPAASESPVASESPAPAAADTGAIAQSEIDALMNAAPSESPAASENPAPALADTGAIAQAEIDALMGAAASESPAPAANANAIAQTEIDALAAEMSAAIEAEAAGTSKRNVVAAAPPAAPVAPLADGAALFDAPELSESDAACATSLDMLDDVQLDVKIELGRTHMYIEDVLKLGAGSVVELDKLAGDPVDIFVNERLIARGEVLVLNDNFCVRINAIHNPVSELEVG